MTDWYSPLQSSSRLSSMTLEVCKMLQLSSIHVNPMGSMQHTLNTKKMSCKKDGSTLNWKYSMIVRVVLKMSSWVQATVYLTLAPSTSTSVSGNFFGGLCICDLIDEQSNATLG